jgi:hypothetical protein
VRVFSVALKVVPVQLSIVLPLVDTVRAENLLIVGFVEVGF